MLSNLQGRSSRILSANGAPDSTVGKNGDFYISRTVGAIYGPKTDGVWPDPIIFGSSGSGSTSVTRKTPPYKITNVGDQTITLPVSDVDYIGIYINGLLQPDSYTKSGATITISSDLNFKIDDVLQIVYTYGSAGGGGGGGGGGGLASIPIEEVPARANNANNTMFTLSQVPIPNTLSIFINGLRLNPDEYSLNNKTIDLNFELDGRICVTYEQEL